MTNILELTQPINVVLINVNITDLTDTDRKNNTKSYKNGNNYGKYSIEDETEDDANRSRPDILFFSLLSLQDSIVNMKKLLNVYVVTRDGLVIRVSNTFRIPRTYNLFIKVIKILLNSEDLVLKASDSDEVLLQVLPNSISDYISKGVDINITNEGYLVDFRKFLTCKSDAINKTQFTFYINAGTDLYNLSPLNDYNENAINEASKERKDLKALEARLLSLITASRSAKTPSLASELPTRLEISLSRTNLTASAVCFKLVCDLEHVFNL